MKRSRGSPSKNQQDPTQLAEEKVSSAKKQKVGVITCLSEKPRVTKRVSFNKNRTHNTFDVQFYSTSILIHERIYREISPLKTRVPLNSSVVSYFSRRVKETFLSRFYMYLRKSAIFCLEPRYFLPRRGA